jgi:4-amino-4-deoxy-L-arabinose transferase-like glycosyltransferase
MLDVIAILAGAFLSGIASLCLGLVLFGRLDLRLERTEYISLAFVVGSACFSQLIFVLSSMHLARESVFVALALFAVGITVGISGRIRSAVRLTTLPRRWIPFSVLLFAPFAVVYLVNAMAPERSPDGAAYHLPFLAHYLRAHGFERIPGDFYASLSQGIDLLFLPAVSLGGHSSAAVVHFLFFLNLPVLMISYGRRIGFPIPAAFLVFASPVVGWAGTSAYVDVAAATVMFALFYLLQIWDSVQDPNLLVPIGILAGFSYAAKYSGAIAVPYALGFVVWRLWRSGNSSSSPCLLSLSAPHSSSCPGWSRTHSSPAIRSRLLPIIYFLIRMSTCLSNGNTHRTCATITSQTG